MKLEGEPYEIPECCVNVLKLEENAEINFDQDKAYRIE